METATVESCCGCRERALSEFMRQGLLTAVLSGSGALAEGCVYILVSFLSDYQQFFVSWFRHREVLRCRSSLSVLFSL